MSSEKVVGLAEAARALRVGDSLTFGQFGDPTLIDLMQRALDFHYEDGRDEDGCLVKAEDVDESKSTAMRNFLQELLDVNAETINDAFAAADSH